MISPETIPHVNYALRKDPAGIHILAGRFYIFVRHDYRKVHAIEYRDKQECFSLQELSYYTPVLQMDAVMPLIYVMDIHNIKEITNGRLKGTTITHLLTEFV